MTDNGMVNLYVKHCNLIEQKVYVAFPVLKSGLLELHQQADARLSAGWQSLTSRLLPERRCKDKQIFSPLHGLRQAGMGWYGKRWNKAVRIVAHVAEKR